MFKIDIESQDKDITEHEFNNECKSMDVKRREMLILVESGQDVEPPKKWFKEMCLQVGRDHPRYTIHKKRTVVIGMWNNMTKNTKVEIIQEYYERWCLN